MAHSCRNREFRIAGVMYESARRRMLDRTVLYESVIVQYGPY